MTTLQKCYIPFQADSTTLQAKSPTNCNNSTSLQGCAQVISTLVGIKKELPKIFATLSFPVENIGIEPMTF